MTVADNTSRNQYTATSGQTVFAYTFEIVDKDDIVVLKNGTTLSEGTDYTVSNVGNDNGGNVTLTVGATAGDIMTLYRDMAYVRTQNYADSGDFLASEVNTDFDNLWLAGEQTNRSFSQSIRKPITDSDSISMELPEAADRANSFLTFDATGAPTVTSVGDPGAPSSIVRQQFTGDGTTTAFTLASAPGALGQSVQIFIDGVYQENDTYSISGTTLTFTEAPPVNASIETVRFEVNDIGETSANLVSYTPAGTGAVQTTVQTKLRESVSVKDFGAVGDGVTDDTAAIQAAIDSGASQIIFSSGTYLVRSVGTVTYDSASFNYCLKIPSNITLKGLHTKSIIKLDDSQDAVVFINSNFAGSNSRITLRDLYIDGNSTNQTASFNKADGFLLNNIFNLEIIDCEVFQSAGYGFRLDTVQNFKYQGLRVTTESVANRDGCKLIDHRYGTISDCNFNTGDDGFSITAYNRDVSNISVSNIVSTSSLARGFLINLHGTAEAAGTERTFSNINATGITTRSCNGPSVLLEYGNYQNCNIQNVDDSSECGLRIWLATANVSGSLSNCSFDVVARNNTEEGILIKDLALGETAFDNKLKAVIEDCGDGFHGIRIGFGSRWSVNAVVDYDPANSKVSPTTAVACLASYSNLNLIVDKGVNNLFMSSGDYNTVTNGVFTNATGGGLAAINILSGSDNHTVVGNLVDKKINNAGSGSFISNNGGNSNKGTATFSGDSSTTTFNIPHGLPTTPTFWQVTPAAGGARGDHYVTASSTNLTLNFNTAPGTATNNIVVKWLAEI